jgi:hypothetical protein
VALALSSQPTLYFATESGLGVLTPGGTPFPKTVARPRGLAVDRTGQLVAIDAGQLHPPTGPALTFSLPQSGGSAKALSNLQAVVQMSNGDWLVADGSERSLQRFSSSGVFIGTFGTGKFTRLAITGSDDVAALDRDQKAVVVFDGVGTVMAKVPLRATGYDLENAEDLTFDAFGHLYVLARNALGIFSPYPAAPAVTGAPAAPSAAAPASRAAGYRLLTVFAPPQNSPAEIRRGTALAVDASGAVFLYDDRAEQVKVYR